MTAPPATERPGAVVTGTNRVALAVVRSLGRRGIPVVLVRTLDHDVTTLSRYVRGHGAWHGTEDERVEALVAVAARHGLQRPVLVPSDDEEAALMARHRERLAASFRLTTPPWDVLRRGYDKREMHALATELGLDQPWTLVPAGEDEVARLRCPFPAVIKPATKPARNALTVAKAWRVDDRAALVRRYAEACRLLDPGTLMVQELVPGDGTAQLSFAALCADGAVLASLTARRRRQYPVDFGHNSTLVETIEDPEAEDAARRLIAALRWTGVLEVEFKRDPRSGTTKLLDVNARGWTWQSLGARAGVDFPYLLWRQATGQPVAPARAIPGVRWIRMGPDLLAAAEERRRGRLSAASYVASLRRPRELAVYARDDRVPALASPLVAAYRAGRAALRRAGAHVSTP
jgi:D-aspartate ligase